MAIRLDVTPSSRRMPWPSLMRGLRKCGIATAVAMAAVPSCGVDITYSADPITAWVVDKDTGAPIQGVNVVAAWELKGGLEGGNIMGYVMVMEAVTDTSGKFSFPGWGPKRHRGSGIIRSGAPKLIFFKSGYYSGAEANSNLTEAAPKHMHSDWDGKNVPLPRFNGSLKEYADTFSFLDIQIDALLSTKECNWRAIPKFLWALDQQVRLFNAGDATRWRIPTLTSLDESYGRRNPDCTGLKQYVEEHGR